LNQEEQRLKDLKQGKSDKDGEKKLQAELTELKEKQEKEEKRLDEVQKQGKKRRDELDRVIARIDSLTSEASILQIETRQKEVLKKTKLDEGKFNGVEVPTTANGEVDYTFLGLDDDAGVRSVQDLIKGFEEKIKDLQA